MPSDKSYLGDSVYIMFDGYGYWLTTDNGYGPSNKIYLEPEVLNALNRFVERIEIQKQEIPETQKGTT